MEHQMDSNGDNEAKEPNRNAKISENLQKPDRNAMISENLQKPDRNARISEKLSKLVQKLSPPETSARELQQREQMALKTIQNHRYLSPNSHEVNRSLDAMVERFRAESMPEFGNTIKDLSATILEQPKWVDHQTQDVQWAVMDFLLRSPYAPIQNIRGNRTVMEQHRLAVIAALKEAERIGKESHNGPINAAETEVDSEALLSENFLKQASLGGSSDSLSEWSEVSSDSSTNGDPTKEPPKDDSNIAQPVFTLSKRDTTNLQKSKLPELKELQPPEPFSPYEQSVRDEHLLSRTIHDYSWRNNEIVFAQPAGPDPQDNFALTYILAKNLETGSDLPLPSTDTEPYLLREILFMFVLPATCLFFDFDKQAQRITVRRNVSICTVTEDTLRDFLEGNVVPALEDMLHLRRIIDDHTLFLDEATTGTLECFAYGLRDLVQPISKLLVEYENRVADNDIEATLMDFTFKFKDHFKQLQLLRLLAKDAILGEGPQHLRSAYLLSRLYRETQPQVPHQKLATALLLVSLKRYCSIIDTWWKRPWLDDRQNEFIVEGSVQEDTVRKRSVPPDASPRVKEGFDVLRDCPFYKIMLDHALEAGDLRDLLAEQNLLGELLATSNESQTRSLYDELVAQLFKQLKVYCGEAEGEEQAESKEPEPEPGQTADEELLASVQGIVNLDLLNIFTRPARERVMEREETEKKERQEADVSVRAILDKLERSTCLQIKAELPEALYKILLRRQGLANEYAMRACRENLQLGKNVRFLRHTMMLEAYHLLFPYYKKLFGRIEESTDWAEEGLLSSELYEVLLPEYPQLAGNLHVQVISEECDSKRVHEALEALELVYDMPPALQRILTEKHIKGYNSVWRLMLKMKWAVWKLENMSFVRRTNIKPSAPLDLLGPTIRRLEILRFWMMNIMNSLHTYIMGCALAEPFEPKISQCKSLRELCAQHDAYVAKLLKHCLLTEVFANFRVVLKQIFQLVFILNLEWNNFKGHVNNDAHRLAYPITEDDFNSGPRDKNLLHEQVAKMQETYIRCHQILGEILRSLVYQQDHGFLKALEVDINKSIPCLMESP